MKIEWLIEPADIARVRAFFDRHCDNPLVRKRVERNLRAEKPVVTREKFWDRMPLINDIPASQRRKT